MRTDAEHRALDERLDILGWGIALIVLAVVLYLPGTRALWHYLVPFGLVFIAMTGVRKLLKTRRDTEGLILGGATLLVGVLDMMGVDFRFLPLVPTILVLVGGLLVINAVASKRLRLDPNRPPERTEGPSGV
jgi:hypothetical protein